MNDDASKTQTWVAVDEAKTLESGHVYIMDSNPELIDNADVLLTDKYTTFTRITAYTGGTTPIVSSNPEAAADPDAPTATSIKPDIYDPSYRGETKTSTIQEIYSGFVYGTKANLVLTLNGAVVGATYRCSFGAKTDAEAFANSFDIVATEENTNNGVMTYTIENLLDTTAISSLLSSTERYIAVKNIVLDDHNNITAYSKTYWQR